MIFVVFDTWALLNAFKNIDPYANALDTLDIVCDKMAVSQPIMKEFHNKLHSTGLTLVLFTKKLSELLGKGKIVKIKRTNLTKARRKIRDNNLLLPNDSDDHKFIEAAIAVHARYIITTDNGMLSMNPYKYDNNAIIEIITPSDYTERRRQRNN